MAHSHITRDGQRIPLNEMSDSHLLNTIKFLKRKAQKGVVISYGGGVEADEIWYDEDVIYGMEALDHLNYTIYVEEARRRGLVIGA